MEQITIIVADDNTPIPSPVVSVNIVASEILASISEVSELSAAQLAAIEQHLNDATREGSAGIPFRVKVDNFPVQPQIIYPYTVHRGVDGTGVIWDMIIYHSTFPVIYYVNDTGQKTIARPTGFVFANSGGAPVAPFLDIKIQNLPTEIILSAGGAYKTVLIAITNSGNVDINGFSGRLGKPTQFDAAMKSDPQVNFNGVVYRNDNSLFVFTNNLNNIGYTTSTVLRPGESKYIFADFGAKPIASIGTTTITNSVFNLNGESNTTNNSSNLQFTVTAALPTGQDYEIKSDVSSLQVGMYSDPRLMVVEINNKTNIVGAITAHINYNSNDVDIYPNGNPQVDYDGQVVNNDIERFSVEPSAGTLIVYNNDPILGNQTNRIYFWLAPSQVAQAGQFGTITLLVQLSEGTDNDLSDNEFTIDYEITVD